MNRLPLGVTASCKNCGHNMGNNIYNDQDDPVCTYICRY